METGKIISLGLKICAGLVIAAGAVLGINKLCEWNKTPSQKKKKSSPPQEPEVSHEEMENGEENMLDDKVSNFAEKVSKVAEVCGKIVVCAQALFVVVEGIKKLFAPPQQDCFGNPYGGYYSGYGPEQGAFNHQDLGGGFTRISPNIIQAPLYQPSNTYRF